MPRFTKTQNIARIRMFTLLSTDMRPVPVDTWASGWSYIGLPEGEEPPPQPIYFQVTIRTGTVIAYPTTY